MWAPDDYGEADLLGVTEEGAIRAGAEPGFAALRIPNDPERSGPRFEGTVAEFQASHGGTEFAKEFAKNLAGTGMTPTAQESEFERQALDAQLHNLVRKCAACGKSCGFTMTHCNGCSAELPQETVHTDNIFMSFVYGIAKVSYEATPAPHEPRTEPRVCVHGCRVIASRTTSRCGYRRGSCWCSTTLSRCPPATSAPSPPPAGRPTGACCCAHRRRASRW